MDRDTPEAKFPPSPPQLCRKVSNLCGVLSRIIREAALLRCTRLQLHALHCGVTAAAAEI